MTGYFHRLLLLHFFFWKLIRMTFAPDLPESSDESLRDTCGGCDEKSAQQAE